ncbi:MAG: ABC transporter ATP-binding protein [Lachnospiraceae bacterium]|nr:ABC transporter ATP-binding protein [Lachnospiraceae bacterium]
MSEIVFNKTSVGYNGIPIVVDVNFTADKGRISALIGPNGAGKSTVLKTAAGLIKPVSGQVLIRDKAIDSYSSADLYSILSVMMTERVKVGFMTAFDVVRVGRYRYTGIFGRLTEDDRSVIKESMEMIGVWDLRDREYNTLSDGQKQRVLLARAIVSEPGILIMDEPASFLDMGRKIEFFDALTEYVKEKNIAVLISMHEVELIRKVADKVICIGQNGRIDAIGQAKELINPEYMEKLFGMKKGKYEEYFG